MPRISAFFGIVVRMFYNDHSPPHFHAEYGEYEAVYEIETIEVLAGTPQRGPFAPGRRRDRSDAVGGHRKPALS